MPTPSEDEFFPIPRISLRHCGFYYAGLLPIIIVLWAWADSATNHTNWHHRLEGGGTRGFIIANSVFRVEVVSRMPGNETAVPPTPIYGGIIRFGAPRHDREGNPMPLFPPLDWHDEEATHRAAGWHVDTFVMPLWFVVACYLPLWLATSYFLVHRKRKKLLSALPCNRRSAI